MWVRTLALTAALLAALPILAEAQEDVVLQEEAATAPRIGPIRIVLLDGCFHATLQQAVARTRTTLPVAVDSHYLVAAGSGCQLTLSKVKPELTALAKAEEAAQQLALRHHQPIPLTIFYIGTTFYGAPDSWKQAVDRLARAAIIIDPAGNDPNYLAADLWPSNAVKIGNAPSGEIQGSRGKAVSVYLDYGGGVDVIVNGQRWTTGATSTAAMFFVSHLGNVLSRGVGATRTPADIQARIKAAFREEVVKDEDLEERLEAVLR